MQQSVESHKGMRATELREQYGFASIRWAYGEPQAGFDEIQIVRREIGHRDVPELLHRGRLVNRLRSSRLLMLSNEAPETVE